MLNITNHWENEKTTMKYHVTSLRIAVIKEDYK